MTLSAAEAANVELVRHFWEALKRRDFDAVGAFMSERGHYIDVPLVDGEEGAIGPEQTAARLRLGLAPLERYVLHDGTIVAQGDVVVTDADGVVVVPQAMIATVLDRLEAVKRAEADLDAKVKAGLQLPPFIQGLMDGGRFKEID